MINPTIRGTFNRLTNTVKMISGEEKTFRNAELSAASGTHAETMLNKWARGTGRIGNNECIKVH
ncbi:hypothetical protein [Moritella sp. F3]|uniref:hypothetical protein n=1 Tax=Moritella sp. F3 TaxID=2718882 RepID=UPI0018E0DDAF|nr:hypothetical protein [Moritella sp. F3]GIC77206.1 hypothetical protein FMO001_19330 [Moritella sp. F1]GIC82325.1 hypothetical protein FMO003_26060 [Moritella sp. F3]